MNANAHTWKACWGQPLAGSNPASSALGGRPATRMAGFDRAWMVVVITAVLTAFAGLATGRRLTGVPEVAGNAETADDAATGICGTSRTSS